MVLKEFPKSLLFDILKILHFETGLYSVKCYYPGLLKTINFPDSSVGKESACNSGDPGSIPGLRRSPGEGNGYPVFLPGEFHGQKSLQSMG